MTCAQLTQAQILTLKAARGLAPDDRSLVKKELFTLIKEKFGIPADHKLTVEIDDADAPDYAAIKNKNSRMKYAIRTADGKWVGSDRQMTVPPAQPKRWFMVDARDAKDALANFLASDGVDFEDGDTDLEISCAGHLEGDIRIDFDGDLWVQLTEDELI